MPTDEQLYSRYLNGENDALDELLVRHKDGLTHFIYGIVRDFAESEDLMMDTFALLIAKRVNFRGESTFKTWLYGVGRNMAMRYLRRNRIHTEKVNLIVSDSIREWVDNDLAQEYIDAQMKRDLENALSSMKEEYSTVLFLQYVEEMKPEHISKVLKKSNKQVYNLTERAKRRLKEIMSEYQD